MGALMRSHDWRGTALGELKAWPGAAPTGRAERRAVRRFCACRAIKELYFLGAAA